MGKHEVLIPLGRLALAKRIAEIVEHLQRDPETIAATGGTNWQKYLPPRFQRRIFYPYLWSDTEKEEWGKAWVEEARQNN